MRYQLQAPILAHDQVSDTQFELTVRAPEVALAARPGQFLHILYDETYRPFTRRPFSVFRANLERGEVSIVYLARGVFTRGLRGKRPGEHLSIVGPLGTCFEPAAEPGSTHVLVAGGVGAPPLCFLARVMVDAGIRRIAVVNGARTESQLIGFPEFAELGVDLRCTTDDGSFGERGLVTDALAPLLAEAVGPAHVYTCGPTPMMKAVAAICSERGVPCDVSLETVMPCGLGVCMGCVVKARDPDAQAGFAYLRACHEGPVFRADRLVWD